MLHCNPSNRATMTTESMATIIDLNIPMMMMSRATSLRIPGRPVLSSCSINCGQNYIDADIRNFKLHLHKVEAGEEKPKQSTVHQQEGCGGLFIVASSVYKVSRVEGRMYTLICFIYFWVKLWP